MGWNVFSADERDGWDEYFERLSDAGVYHDPTYLTTLAGNFEPPEIAELFVFDPEGTSGFVYYPYLRRPLNDLSFAEAGSTPEYSDIVSSWYYGGPLLSGPDADPTLPEQFADSFGEMCDDRGIVAEFVRFDPLLENHEAFDCLDPTFNRETVPVDLSGSASDVWEGYEGRNQRAIKQAEETDITVEPTRDPTDVDSFHDIYRSAMEARDAAPHYRFDVEFFHELVRDLPGVATLLVARYEGEVIGGFIAVHDDSVAHHFLSASIPDYWDLRVNNLLYHEVVMHFHDRGFRTFDFQGGRPGVFKFKKGFSQNRGQFYLATRIHLPDVYDDLVRAADQAGIDTDTDYFPAYRVEQSN